MQKYKKNYKKHYGLSDDDIVLCEECGAVAVDLHHIIKRSQGGSDKVENLVALCRDCHNKHHQKARNKMVNSWKEVAQMWQKDCEKLEAENEKLHKLFEQINGDEYGYQIYDKYKESIIESDG